MSRSLVAFCFIVLLAALGQMTADIYLPAMNAVATNLHTPVNLVQFSVSSYMLGFGLAQLFFGILFLHYTA